VSDDAHRPKISTAIRAAIAKPLKFYFAVPSIDLTNWLVVEAGNPEQPMAQLFSSEVEAWAVADAFNDRELKFARPNRLPIARTQPDEVIQNAEHFRFGSKD
jgi:hypothetical protein